LGCLGGSIGIDIPLVTLLILRYPPYWPPSLWWDSVGEGWGGRRRRWWGGGEGGGVKALANCNDYYS